MALTRFAPAKINLSLLVGAPSREIGARFGHHPLNSLVGFCRDLGDELHFENADDLSLTVQGEFADELENQSDSFENNLIIKAARALQNHFGIVFGARIILVKNLPIASGIGGGSADAAATLNTLVELWDLKITASDLAKIGEKLGSDVPICLQNKPAIMSGFGEKLRPAPKFPDIPILLTNPLVACPTAAVYQEYDYQNKFTANHPAFHACENIDELVEMLSLMPNNLEPAAFALHPPVSQLMSELSGLCGQKLVRMSGSGASCFAVFETKEAAEWAKAELERIYERKNQKIWARAAIIDGN